MNPITIDTLHTHRQSLYPSDLQGSYLNSVGSLAVNTKYHNTPVQIQELVYHLERMDLDENLSQLAVKLALKLEYTLPTKEMSRALASMMFMSAEKKQGSSFAAAVSDRAAGDHQAATASLSGHPHKNLAAFNAQILSDCRVNMRTEALYARQAFSETLATSLKAMKELDACSGLDSHNIDTRTSYAELWQRIALALAGIKEGYVDFYAELMQKYTELYESFNNNVQKASSDAVGPGSDGNNVFFNPGYMQVGYKKFEEDTNRLNNELGSVDDWYQMSAAQKENMRSTLEPAFNIDKNGKITFNLEQYDTIKGSTPSGMFLPGNVSTASYQAWLATFNAAGSALQSNMQTFAQRYSQANNTFDNLNKVLSGAISSMAESAKEVFRALG